MPKRPLHKSIALKTLSIPVIKVQTDISKKKEGLELLQEEMFACRFDIKAELWMLKAMLVSPIGGSLAGAGNISEIF